MSKAEWMYAADGEGFGPFTLGQLKQLVATRMISKTDRVWKVGDSESQTVELLLLPPPLPIQKRELIANKRIGVWVSCLILGLFATCFGVLAGTGVLFPKLPELVQNSPVVEPTGEANKNNESGENSGAKANDDSAPQNERPIEEGTEEPLAFNDNKGVASTSSVPDDKSASTRFSAAKKTGAKLDGQPVVRSEPVVTKSKRPDVFDGHTSYVPQLDISPNGKLAATGSNDRSVIVWNIKTGEKVKRWTGFTTNLFGVKFDPDGQSLWMCDRTTVSKCNIESGRILKKFEITKVNGFNQHAVAFNDDCTTLVTKNQGAAFVYNLSNGKKQGQIDDWINSLEFSRVGASVYCGGSENAGEIKLRNASTGNIKTRFRGLNDRTISICESFDGKYVAAAGGPSKGSSLESGDRLPENNLVIWDSNGRVVQKLHVKEGWQWGLTFTPNNRYLIMGGCGKAEIGNEDWFGHQGQTDKGIRFWTIESGKLVKILRGHDAAVLNLAVTPDGKTLISTGADSKVRIWDLDQELASEGN